LDAYRNIELAKALSQLEILREVNDLKNQIDAMRPLPKEIEERILQKLRLDWNYHSNAIEGNPYTYGETVAFLMEGITAKGKTLKDHLDIKGHDDAIQYLLSIVKGKDYRLNETEIRNLHKMLLKEPYFSDAVTVDGQATRKEIKIGAYKSTPNHVKTPTGATHYYASVEETPIKMGELIEWYNAVSDNPEIHPVVVAALFHHQFTAIHPFDDGNGRMARLLMNLILMQRGFIPIVIKQQDRNNYYQVLRIADTGDFPPIVDYISSLCLHSLETYLKGARGESIEEMDDIDKEIVLFKKGFSEDKILMRKNSATSESVFTQSIEPLQRSLARKISQFRDLFFEYDEKVIYSDDWDKNNFHQLAVFDKFPNDIYEIRLVIKLEGFKKVEDPFNYQITIPWRFEDYYYRISDVTFTSMEFRKKYNDQLSTSEIEDITKYAVKRVLEDLKKKLAQ
jgi:Fic family protein